MAGLRQFEFFQSTAVYDLEDGTKSPGIFQKNGEISTICYGQSSIVVADLDGRAHLISAPDFTVTVSWPAFPGGRITHAAFAHSARGILVTVGEEASSPFPILKIWSLSAVFRGKVPASRLTPKLLVNSRLQNSDTPHPVTTLALSPTLSHIGVGLADGSILVSLQTDQIVASATSSSGIATLPKPRTLQQPTHEPITGLHFARSDRSDKAEHAVFFASTTTKVFCYAASGKGQPAVIDDIGCGINCTLVHPKSQTLIMARDEAIYVYNAQAREACIAYEGPKSAIHILDDYLIIVSPPFRPSAASGSATVRQYVAKNRSSESDIARVGIFELNHKFIAHSSAFEQGVQDVFVQWGRVWILSHDSKLSKMEEVPLAAKLDILFTKSLYLLALSLAKEASSDEKDLADIHRRYADSLYGTQHFDEAMSQFLQTIGYTEASYVIRKFLDAERIHNLTSYLEALHGRGLANSAHTSLLLNCFTRLKDADRLDKFLKASTREGDASQPPFDVETAIRVTRQAGYLDHAAYLAKRYDEHEAYLRIQIEDRQLYSEAVQYIRGMGVKAAEQELLHYAKILLTHASSETTQLLIDLCCGRLDAQPIVETPLSPPVQITTAQSYLSYLPLPGTTQTKASPALSRAVSTASATITTPKKPNGAIESVSQPTRTTSNKPRDADLPEPDQFFAQFIDQPEEFIHFLEQVLSLRYDQPYQANETDQVKLLNNTLLEMYIGQAKASDGDQYREKAMALLANKDHVPYSTSQALLVCSTSQFQDGAIVLYEELAAFEIIFDLRLAAHDDLATIDCIKKYGDRAPSLYRKGLVWLSSDAGLLSKHHQATKDILFHIQQENLMKPVEVVRLLGRNNAATIGLVKEYLFATLTNDREEIDSDKALIESYRKEVAAKTREVQILSNVKEPHVFQVTRCTACGGSLDLPSVHFMCKHSFHQRCLPDTEAKDCPVCAREHGLIKEIQRANEKATGQANFINEIQESDDPFQTIASAFSRGFANARVGA